MTRTVHDTENLTFSKEFCGCSMQTPTDSCAVRRGSFACADMNLPLIWVENGGNQKANFVCNNAEGRHRKDRLNYHCRNRAPLIFPQFTSQ